jgi:uncharacterized protein (TIGR04255 family)
MPDPLPIPIPTRLPVRIDPCPIVEAVFEIRFTSTETWSTMPGLLYAQIREKYREQRQLPIASLPEEMRRQDPALARLPLMQFLGGDFLIQLGARVVSLVTKPNAYPGWAAIETELRWMLERLQGAGFVNEGERLGVRYIDFMAEDVFQNLILGLQVAGQALAGVQADVTTVFSREPLTIRLQVANGAIVARPSGPQRGSVLDLDAWFGALDFGVFSNSMNRFSEAHCAIKKLFFGLLRPEYLAKLNPVYE